MSSDVLRDGYNQAVTYEQALQVRLIGQAGDAARGTMGLEVSAEEAQAAMETAATMVVAVDPEEPTTCMDDGEAAGLLSDEPTVPRLKMAGGDAMGSFMSDELTRTRREQRGEVRPVEQLHSSPIERMRAVRKERVQEGDAAVGIHLRLDAAKHGGEGASGCGMADRNPGVQQVIVEEAYRADGDRVAALTAAAMRTDFRYDVHAGVVTDAARLQREVTAHGWSGERFVEGVRHPEPGQPPLEWGASTYDKHIEVTAGEHAPVALVIHYGDGTLDRDRFVDVTGRKLLWIDEPALWGEACKRAPNPTDFDSVTERYQALMTANIAGALKLGAKHLHVGTIGTPQPAVLSVR